MDRLAKSNVGKTSVGGEDGGGTGGGGGGRAIHGNSVVLPRNNRNAAKGGTVGFVRASNLMAQRDNGAGERRDSRSSVGGGGCNNDAEERPTAHPVMTSKSVVGGKGHAFLTAVGAQSSGKVGRGSSAPVGGGTSGSLSSWGCPSDRSSSSSSNNSSSRSGGKVSDKASRGISASAAATSKGQFVTFGQSQRRGAVKKKTVLLPLRVVGLHFRGRETTVATSSSHKTGFSWGGGKNPSPTKLALQSVQSRAGSTHGDTAGTPPIPANARLELEREPHNVYDPNAIKVIRQTAAKYVLGLCI